MKQVRFKESEKSDIREMHVWSYASREARRGEWEQMARDRDRFMRRVERMAAILDPVLLKKYAEYNNLLEIDLS
jgi:hypothetical protein